MPSLFLPRKDEKRECTCKQNDENIHGSKHERSESIEEKAVAEAVKSAVEQDHFADIHQNCCERCSDCGESEREKFPLFKEKRTRENAACYAEKDKERSHQNRGDRQNGKCTVAVECRKASPDAHTEEGYTCDRLQNECTQTLFLAREDDVSKAVKGVQKRYDQNDGNDIKMKLKSRAVIADENLERCQITNLYLSDGSPTHPHLPAFERGSHGISYDDLTFEQKLRNEKDCERNAANTKECIFFAKFE